MNKQERERAVQQIRARKEAAHYKREMKRLYDLSDRHYFLVEKHQTALDAIEAEIQRVRKEGVR